MLSSTSWDSSDLVQIQKEKDLLPKKKKRRKILKNNNKEGKNPIGQVNLSQCGLINNL